VNEKERIAVRVPCGWEMSASLALFLSSLSKMSHARACPYDFHIGAAQNFRPVDHARNMIVKEFLDDESLSRLWFIDSDILPPRECLELLGSEDDIVAAAYDIWGRYTRDGLVVATPTSYVEAPESDEGPFWNPAAVPEDGFYRVDAAGTGMMIIKRKVLEDEGMKIHGDRDWLFQNVYGRLGKIVVSDDLDFCRRAKACGYTIAVHGGVRPGHVKTVNVRDIVAFAEAERNVNGGSQNLLVHPA
jgi:hypothetical protein